MKISVIIPAYNSGEFITETLQSVADQSHRAHEIIVVDDGSTDDTSEKAKSFCNDITLITQPKNGGVSKARNAGADVATAPWLMFLDSDDILTPTALGDLSRCASAGSAGVVFGNVLQFGKNGKLNKRGFDCAGEPPRPAKKNFWRAAIPTPGAAIVSKDLHCKIGGFEKPWQPTEDRDYWMKCGVLARFDCCDQLILNKRYREQSSREKSDIAVYWGMRVQLEFLEWCNARGIDTDFIDVDQKEIVAKAISLSIQNDDTATLEEIRQYVKEHRVKAPGRLYELYCRFINR